MANRNDSRRISHEEATIEFLELSAVHDPQHIIEQSLDDWVESLQGSLTQAVASLVSPIEVQYGSVSRFLESNIATSGRGLEVATSLRAMSKVKVTAGSEAERLRGVLEQRMLSDVASVSQGQVPPAKIRVYINQVMGEHTESLLNLLQMSAALLRPPCEGCAEKIIQREQRSLCDVGTDPVPDYLFQFDNPVRSQDHIEMLQQQLTRHTAEYEKKVAGLLQEIVFLKAKLLDGKYNDRQRIPSVIETTYDVVQHHQVRPHVTSAMVRTRLQAALGHQRTMDERLAKLVAQHRVQMEAIQRENSEQLERVVNRMQMDIDMLLKQLRLWEEHDCGIDAILKAHAEQMEEYEKRFAQMEANHKSSELKMKHQITQVNGNFKLKLDEAEKRTTQKHEELLNARQSLDQLSKKCDFLEVQVVRAEQRYSDLQTTLNTAQQDTRELREASDGLRRRLSVAKDQVVNAGRQAVEQLQIAQMQLKDQSERHRQLVHDHEQLWVRYKAGINEFVGKEIANDMKRHLEKFQYVETALPRLSEFEDRLQRCGANLVKLFYHVERDRVSSAIAHMQREDWRVTVTRLAASATASGVPLSRGGEYDDMQVMLVMVKKDNAKLTAQVAELTSGLQQSERKLLLTNKELSQLQRRLGTAMRRPNMESVATQTYGYRERASIVQTSSAALASVPPLSRESSDDAVPIQATIVVPLQQAATNFSNSAKVAAKRRWTMLRNVIRFIDTDKRNVFIRVHDRGQQLLEKARRNSAVIFQERQQRLEELLEAAAAYKAPPPPRVVTPQPDTLHRNATLSVLSFPDEGMISRCAVPQTPLFKPTSQRILDTPDRSPVKQGLPESVVRYEREHRPQTAEQRTFHAGLSQPPNSPRSKQSSLPGAASNAAATPERARTKSLATSMSPIGPKQQSLHMRFVPVPRTADAIGHDAWQRQHQQEESRHLLQHQQQSSSPKPLPLRRPQSAPRLQVVSSAMGTPLLKFNKPSPASPLSRAGKLQLYYSPSAVRSVTNNSRE
eukprot:TRINITY_DN9822_c0_g1_i1.p1 TRINITY_DN9822_c0_g1~~TRINITY_DN9822_c0_g1_i1.p1  ORF type:complete len:1014 (+),score=263.15 TRINITY_DN9822_c0_g1_i1:84-3125(+)